MNLNSRTEERNDRLWGARAQDWARFQEGRQRAAYDAILPRFAGRGTRHLDLGCGSGMAAQIAHDPGAIFRCLVATAGEQ